VLGRGRLLEPADHGRLPAVLGGVQDRQRAASGPVAQEQSRAQEVLTVLAAVDVHGPGDGLLDLVAVVDQLLVRAGAVGVVELDQVAALGGDPPRQRHHGLDGGLGEAVVRVVQVLRQHVRQLALAAQRDQLHRREALLVVLASARLAQGLVKGLDLLEDAELERFGEGLVERDHARQAGDGLAPQQRVEDDGLLGLVAHFEGFEKHVIGGMVVGGDERLDELLDHLLGVIGRWVGET
jgi:hypothetical protein